VSRAKESGATRTKSPQDRTLQDNYPRFDLGFSDVDCSTALGAAPQPVARLHGMDDRSEQIRAVCIICLTLSIVFGLLRVYVRYGLLRRFGMDDWLMMATLVNMARFLLIESCKDGRVPGW
jgi:hypothetical protein